MRALICWFSLSILSSQSAATGLEELTQMLNQLPATQAATVEYSLLYTRVEDEDDEDDKKIFNGELAFNVREDYQGLHISYDSITLNSMESESDQKTLDLEAESPTLTAMRFLETTDIKTSLNAVNQLKRVIDQSEFISEQAVELLDKKLRKLTFKMPLKLLITHPKTQKYVDSFTSQLEVYINNQGIPVQSEVSYKGKGRAYLVISMKVEGSVLTEYELVGDRLIEKYHLEISRYDSTFGAGSVKKQQILQVVTN